jgi:hypothetical protein
MRLPFIGPAYVHKSLPVSAQRCVNLFPELTEAPPGKEGEVESLQPCPGLMAVDLFSDSTLAGACRGFHRTKDGYVIAVYGSAVVLIKSLNNYDLCGALSTFSGPVSIADNGVKAMLVDGPNGYVIDLTMAIPSIVVITDPDFLGSTTVSFLDGYFLLHQPGTGKMYITDLYSTDINALDFTIAEGSPDNLVAIEVTNREAWAFGTDSTEVYTNTGNADFPFERIDGAFIEYGLAAPYSPKHLDNSVIWVSADENGHGIVMQSHGYTPRRISTHTVEQAIQSYGSITDAVATSYQKDGHIFYILNFTRANTTWVYDLTSKRWHERTSRNTVTGLYGRHVGQYWIFAFNEHLVGHYRDSTLLIARQNVYTEMCGAIERVRSCPHISKDLKNVFYNWFQLDLEVGVGIDGKSEPIAGVNPQVVLRISNDGGKTWSSDLHCSYGKIGEYKARARWNRLGCARDRVFEVRITDPTVVSILGANMDAVAGES